MKFRPVHFIFFVIVIALIWGIKLIFFSAGAELLFFGGFEDKRSCEIDSDCVPAQCCHPTSSVNKKYSPDCSDTFCTLQCKPNTLDCNQGQIKCINNKCEAIISE